MSHLFTRIARAIDALREPGTTYVAERLDDGSGIAVSRRIGETTVRIGVVQPDGTLAPAIFHGAGINAERDRLDTALARLRGADSCYACGGPRFATMRPPAGVPVCHGCGGRGAS